MRKIALGHRGELLLGLGIAMLFGTLIGGTIYSSSMGPEHGSNGHKIDLDEPDVDALVEDLKKEGLVRPEGSQDETERPTHETPE